MHGDALDRAAEEMAAKDEVGVAAVDRVHQQTSAHIAEDLIGVLVG
jgi:hypothetical protein